MVMADLIYLVSELYNTPSYDQDIAMYMNMAQKELSAYFPVTVQDSTVTVADQDEYSLPTGCDDISRIISLGVSKHIPPTDRYDYTYYHKATPDDYAKQRNSYYQVVNEDGTKSFVLYPIPTEDDYVISVKYTRDLVDLDYTDDDQVPEFDARYHHLLAYYACKWLAAHGETPDPVQADYFSQEWDRGLYEIHRLYLQKSASHPRRRRDNPHWVGGKRHTAGGAASEGGGEV